MTLSMKNILISKQDFFYNTIKQKILQKSKENSEKIDKSEKEREREEKNKVRQNGERETGMKQHKISTVSTRKGFK